MMPHPGSRAPTTAALLSCGVVAGPLYVALGVIQVLIRPGFDPTRHPLSLMSNGDLGWIQVSNFVLTGVLTVAAAIGMRRVIEGSPGGTWGPLLLGLYGLGLVGAGFFKADPMNGFPPGTPEGPPLHPSLHSNLHILSGSVGFLGLIAACLILARRFAVLRQRGWALYSALTGIIFLGAFVGIGTGSQQQGTVLTVVTLVFTAAVVLAWSWISLLAARLKGES